jgi:hypothetical protein
MDLRLKAPITIDSLRIELVRTDELRLEGRLTEDSAREELTRHLRDLHSHVLSHRLRSFTVDVRALAVVNSSAIRCFVDLASRAEGAGYALIFEVDSSITWHRLSFSVLQSLAPNCVQIRQSIRPDADLSR